MEPQSYFFGIKFNVMDLSHTLIFLAICSLQLSTGDFYKTLLSSKKFTPRWQEVASHNHYESDTDYLNNTTDLGVSFPSQVLMDSSLEENLVADLDLESPKVFQHSYGYTSYQHARRLQKRSTNKMTDLRYQGCRTDHNPNIRVGLTKGDRFLCYYSKFFPCDMDEEPEIDIWASGGILHFTSPCCLNHCSVNFRIQAPPGQELFLEFLDMRISTVKGQNSDGTHLCYDSHMFFQTFWYRFCGDKPPPLLRIMKRRVDFMLLLRDNSLCPAGNRVTFTLRYRSCSPTNITTDICPQQLVYTAPGLRGSVKTPGFDWVPGLRGSVKTPGFDWVGTYPANTLCHWNITVNAGYLIRLHFVWFRLPADKEDPDVLKIHIHEYDAQLPPAPALLIYEDQMLDNIPGYKIVLPSKTAVLEFSSDDEDFNKGFNVEFEAVDPGMYVPIVDEMTLNCTDRNLSSLPAHIRCNFRDDCLNGEDETDCSYNSTSCPQGGYLLDYKCVYIHVPDSPISWEQADQLCVDRYGGQLFTPRNVAETSYVKNLIAKDFHVFVSSWFFGIRDHNGKIKNSGSRMSSLYETQTGYGSRYKTNVAESLLYRRMQAARDGTTVFNYLGYYQSAELASCVMWTSSNSNNGHYLWRVPCNRPYVPFKRTGKAQNVHVLCQVKKADLASKPRPIIPSKPVNLENWENGSTFNQQLNIENKTSSYAEELRKNNDTNWVDAIGTFNCLISLEIISASRRCDRVPDCFDASDEKDCEDYMVTSLIPERFQCPTGLQVSYSHICDGINDCLDDETFCHPEQEEVGKTRVCENGQAVPLATWCDAKQDCLDGSDEIGCEECSSGAVLCPGVGCYPEHWVDDGELDCTIQGKDGRWAMEPDFSSRFVDGVPPPAVVIPDGHGKARLVPLVTQGDPDTLQPCPATHAQCHGQGYCIPDFMLCNGVKDCPDGEDELTETCQAFCKNRFQCHGSSICLHASRVCDGWPHCPLHDDETQCPSQSNLQTTCPENCQCSTSGQPIEMVCDIELLDNSRRKNIGVKDSLRRVKYIRVTPSKNLPLKTFKGNLEIVAHRLVRLEVPFAGVKEISTLSCPQLYELHMNGNFLVDMPSETFRTTTETRILDLSYNKLQISEFEFLKYLRHLELLDLSYNNLTSVEQFSFASCPMLKRIILHGMGISVISNDAFGGLANLQHLDLVDNTISRFGPSVLSGLSQLSLLNTDNYRLCCSQVAPESLLRGTCRAPTDEISSCEDILATEFFRVFLWVVAVFTILGNGGVLVYRLLVERRKSQASSRGGRQHQQLGYSTFITSLAASDFLMGIYLCVIGGADVHYRGRFLWGFSEWTRSGLCSVAGFLCFVSSEVSELTIALVTLDRFLALAFPLSEKLHFGPLSARLTSLAAWVVGVILAAVPLFPQLDAQWDRFYSQNGVCIPLPITRAQYPGKDYSFAVFVVFNMIIFLLIVFGQILIYLAVRSHSMNAQKKGKGVDGKISEMNKFSKSDAHRTKQQQQAAAIARKLALVVASDFLCWFPIGVLGLMSRLGIPIPGQVSVAVTVFLLPLNAALNPFLYTLSAIFVDRNSKKKGNSKGSVKARRLDGVPGRGLARSSLSSPSHGIEVCSPDESTSQKGKRDQLRKLKVWITLGKISRQEVLSCLQKFQENFHSLNTVSS